MIDMSLAISPHLPGGDDSIRCLLASRDNVNVHIKVLGGESSRPVPD
jgi:hypothetical protein